MYPGILFIRYLMSLFLICILIGTLSCSSSDKNNSKPAPEEMAAYFVGSVRSLLRQHIRTCREYIRLAAIDSLNAGDLRMNLKQLYREYKTITDEPLPSIDRFYEDVVKPDLEPFPEVRL